MSHTTSRFPPFEMVALVVVTDVRALLPEAAFDSTQLFTSCSSCCEKPIHHTPCRARSRHLAIPRWPEWIFWRMSSRSDLGITIRFPRSGSPSSTDISCATLYPPLCVFLATGSDTIGRVVYTLCPVPGCVRFE